MSSQAALQMQKADDAFSRYLGKQLDGLKQDGLYRMLRDVPEGCVSFCDNDYLGLQQDSRIKAFANQYETGGGASRLVSGNHSLYTQLETSLAQIKRTEAALVFANGFAMNSGVITALAEKGDLILADRLCHASLIDGIRASEANFQRFSHNDMEQLEQLLTKQRSKYRHVFIVTETVFSMDGDKAPINAMLELAEVYDCQLLADDAHGFGVMDGLPVHARLIQLGTLSKAVGSLGGYVCGSQLLIDYLVNHCRSLIYTTALPPMVLAASLKALEIMQAEPERRQKALEFAAHFCEALELPKAQSAIVPLIVGEENAAVEVAKKLQEKGFYVTAIRPPTVPAGTARLRFSFSARHTKQQVEELIVAVKDVLR